MVNPGRRLLDDLRTAYDGQAAVRDATAKDDWKIQERAAFTERVRAAGGLRVLEIGAGTGQDSVHMQQAGRQVTAIDLSEQMVARCRSKGIDARVMQVQDIDFPPEHFDAVYSMNCLLHIPHADLVAVLQRIRGILRPAGLFYLGLWGGEDHEGPLPDDSHDPPRFFAFRTDERLVRAAEECFDIVDFHTLEPRGWHFQSLTLRRSAAA